MILEEIRERLWTLSVFVFSVEDRRARYSGAATCVAAGGTSYLLTAAHVWNALRDGAFAVSLDADRPLIEVPANSATPTRVIQPTEPEWGPDLALIRIPDLIAGEIRQSKAFYNLDRDRPDPAPVAGCEVLTLRTLVGAAAEQAVFGPTEAMMTLSLLDAWNVVPQERNGFDYVDLAFDHERRPGLPLSYRGFSGAGLWDIPILLREGAGEMGWDHSYRLAGLAFYEWADPPRHSFIRCHGPRSIQEGCWTE